MKTKIDVQKAIDLHIVTEGHATKGWVHTHGMSKFKLPELEIRNVPLFLAGAAGNLVNDIADYLLNSGKKVSVGETMDVGGSLGLIRLQKSIPIKGDEEHFADERWEIVSAMDGTCACPNCKVSS